MDEDSREVASAIDALESMDGTDDFCRLHALADRYFALPDAADHLDVWFRLYEWFPNTDADYAFWSILHRIEAQPGYERLVVASVRRKPAWFPVMMVNRLLDGGITSICGIDLLSLLRTVAADEHCPGSVREWAEGFLEYQRRRT